MWKKYFKLFCRCKIPAGKSQVLSQMFLNGLLLPTFWTLDAGHWTLDFFQSPASKPQNPKSNVSQLLKMKNLKNLTLALLAFCAFSLSSCFHIVEELTVKADGTGSYKLNFDMSEMKGMMEMMKGMTPDSLKQEGAEAPQSNQMTELGAQLTSITPLLESLGGIKNIKEVSDTTNFQFSYSFDFENQDALNRALKLIAKEKYQAKQEETFLFSKKKFQRLSVGNIGSELKKQLSENEEAGGEEQMDMMKMFFADMTYKTIYNFEKTVKSSSNKLSEVSADKKTVTLTLKPFDEEQAKTHPSVATDIKLK